METEKNVIDIHCHTAGIGAGGSGCFLSQALRRSWKYRFYLAAFGITQKELELHGRDARATYPRTRRAASSSAYLVLLRMEVAAFHPPVARGLVSVALFVTSPCQGVTLHPALRSPDFPL